MRLISLSLGSEGHIVARVRLDSGNVAQADFTTSTARGITAATPSPDIFMAGPATPGEVRQIVAAVVAFERAATS